jgi:hypothetical protein
MVLLTMVTSASTLRWLARLRSVRVEVEAGVGPGRHPAVRLQYKEIEMRGTLVDAQGEPLILHSITPGATNWYRADGLRVDSIDSQVQRVWREASS